jgi:tRNA(Ile2) C34 agmatinyltransferase TiaS
MAGSTDIPVEKHNGRWGFCEFCLKNRYFESAGEMFRCVECGTDTGKVSELRLPPMTPRELRKFRKKRENWPPR